MKKCFTLLAILFAWSSGFSANFTPGNIVVVRIGDGVAATSSAAQAVFLDEYSPTGTLVQSIALPTADGGGNQTFTLSGSATSEGSLNLSANGQFLSLAGYDAAPGTATVSSSAGIDRIIARVNAQGVVNTSTGIMADGAYKTNNIRGAYTVDGTAFWLSGNGSSNTGGTYYVPFGSVSGTPVQISTSPSNTRTVRVFNNQLYVSSASGSFHGVSSVGTGTPTTAGQTTTILSGFSTTSGPSVYAFILLDLNPNVPGVDVAYVVDDRTTAPDGGIYKYSLVGGTWTSNGNITSSDALRGLTGISVCGKVNMIASSEGTIVALQDTTGYNQTIQGSLIPLATAGTNTKFRGVAFTPGTSIPATLDASISNPTNVSCFGSANGSATVTVTGGTASYTYHWNTGSGSTSISNLTPGSYAVTVTDLLGCKDTASVTITQPAILSLSSNNTNVSCNGGSNGAINLNVSGGTTTYTYHWNDGTQTASRSNLAAGSYAITVTDAHNCTATGTYTISQPPVINPSEQITNLPCQGGGNTGAINLTTTGGNGSPFTFNWSNNATTEDISNLSAGSYTVTISDNAACSATFSYTISQSGNLTLNPTTADITCNGAGNGSISLQPSGGTPAYTYTWSNNSTSASISGLSAGTYSVTVNDNGGCQIVNSYTINEPAAINASATATDLSCYGNMSGSINLPVSGGTSPFTFLWNDGNTSQNRNNIAAGSYSVTITDSHSCTVVRTATVNQPDSINLSLTVVNVTAFGGNDGSVTLTASGGTGSLSYLWSNTATGQSVNNLTAGSYCVTVTDASNCSAEKCAQVDQPNSVLDGTFVSSLYSFIHNGELNTVISTEQQLSFDYKLIDVNGSLISNTRQNISGKATIITNVTALPSGLYLVLIELPGKNLVQKVMIQ